MRCQKLMQWVVASSLALLMIVFITRAGAKPVGSETTRFEVVRLANSSAASFQVLKNGEPFMIKGVCYSPMEINSNINDAEVIPDPKNQSKSMVVGSMFGDTFWDPPALSELGTLEHTLRQTWFGLWGRGSLSEEHSARGDLAKISQELHANAIRVYFMQSRVYSEKHHKVPKSPQDCDKRTHAKFLDEAYGNGLYVLVGLPLPIQLFHEDDYRTSHKELIQWWEFVLAETVAEVGHHPAILGFTIMNELDDEPNAFPGQGTKPQPDHKSDFWHNQMVKYASVVKTLAPHKLVGWALHDCPSWLGFASNATPSAATDYLTTDSTYLEQISSVFDYYGVNTYQSQTLMSVLGPWGDHGELGAGGKAYGAPSIAAHIKPVLLTEIGWPATSRAHLNETTHAPAVGSMVVDNVTTQTAVAKLINTIFPQVYDEYKNMCIGAFYFEYSDEWWKTPKPLAAIESLSGPWYHDGGNNCENFGFPNMCNDEESFGLYALARAGGRSVNSSNFDAAGIVLPVDELIARSPMVEALAEIFASDLTVGQRTSLPFTSAAAIPRSPRLLSHSALFLSIALVLCVGLSLLALKLYRRSEHAVQAQDSRPLQQPFLQVL